jgi:hypothetical protein
MPKDNSNVTSFERKVMLVAAISLGVTSASHVLLWAIGDGLLWLLSAALFLLASGGYALAAYHAK